LLKQASHLQRSIETNFLQRKFAGESTGWEKQLDDDVLEIRWSSDQSKLNVLTRNSSIIQLSANSGSVLKTVQLPNRIVRASFHSDDVAFVASESGECFLMDVSNSSRRLQHVLSDSIEGVASVQLPEESSIFAVVVDRASHGKSLKIWEEKDNDRVFEFALNIDSIRRMQWSDDGRWLAMVGGRDQALLWDRTTRSLFSPLHTPGIYPQTICFADESIWIASGSSETQIAPSVISRWDLTDGKLIETFTDHLGVVRAMKSLDSSNRMISGSEDQSIKFWNTKLNLPLLTIRCSNDTIRRIEVTRDQRMIAIASGERGIQMLDGRDVAAASPVAHVTLPATDIVMELPSNESVIFVESNSRKFVSLDTEAMVQTVLGNLPTEKAIHRSSVSFNGRCVAFADVEQSVHIGFIDDDHIIQWRSLTKITNGYIRGLCFSDEGRTIYVSDGWSTWSATIDMDRFDVSRLELQWEGPQYEFMSLVPYVADTGSLCFLSATGAGKVFCRDRIGAVLQELSEHQAEVRTIAVSPRGLIATGGREREAILWHGLQGAALRLENHDEMISSLAFNLRGDRLYSSSYDGTVRCWDVDTGARLQSWDLESGPIHQVFYTKNNSLIAIEHLQESTKISLISVSD
jgi:WD40 repeat protein